MNGIKQDIARMQELVGEAFNATGSLAALPDNASPESLQKALEEVSGTFEGSTLELRRLCEKHAPGVGGYGNRPAVPRMEVDGFVERFGYGWDALFQGMPFVMAADMDLRRLDDAVEKARQEGHPQIAIAALEGQAETVLFSRYRDTGKARVFILTGEAISEVTGRPPVPYTPPRTQFLTAEGDVIDAPSFKVPGRAGR